MGAPLSSAFRTTTRASILLYQLPGLSGCVCGCDQHARDELKRLLRDVRERLGLPKS